MPSFIETCHCRGRGPSGVQSAHAQGRPNLIAAMLRERGVARFVVASPGYGRSSLAYEYADIVFSFEHVFWVRGTSPCFLRDIDAGTFVADMQACDPDAALVVWEDVPPLSAERVERFAQVVDQLLESGVESLVTCTPSADRYGALHHDRLLLRARDLLLSDAEMDAECEAGRLAKGWEARTADADRIPCVRWCDHDSSALLVRGLQEEELPNDAWLAIAVLLLLQHGSLEDLAAFLPHERIEELAGPLARDYPLFGIDERTGLFNALPVPVEVVLDAFANRMDALAAASLHGSRAALCEHVADALLERGQAQRACAFARACFTKKAGSVWLSRQGWKLLEAGQAQAYCEFHQATTRTATGVVNELSAQRAWAAFILDDEATALKLAHRVMVSRTASAAQQLAAQVLATRAGTADVRARAAEELARNLGEGAPLQPAGSTCNGFADWGLLARVAVGLQDGAASALAAWSEARQQQLRCAFSSGIPAEGADPAAACSPAARTALLLGAAWLIDDYANALDDARAGLPSPCASFDDVAVFARDSLAGEAASARALGWPVVCAASALERVGASNARLAAYLPDAAESALLHRAEIALFEQQEAHRRFSAGVEMAQQRRRRTFRAQLPLEEEETAKAPALGRRSAPFMRVRVFGGFEVRVGERLIDDRLLSRVKTRALFQLLVLNRGREANLVRLMELLWPDSEPKRARKNFYSAWSQLRETFALEDGTCPYLVRTRNGCRIDRDLVTSDVADFDKVCRALLFESPETEDWERIYMLVSTEYGEDLLACETGNEVIAAMRESLRTQLVDGLVAASTRLVRGREARGALWFAREALRRDPKREDVYIALMEAQIASGQRGEALDTYFLCRRFLSESLGIDPSLRLVQLYHSVIESEEVLA